MLKGVGEVMFADFIGVKCGVQTPVQETRIVRSPFQRSSHRWAVLLGSGDRKLALHRRTIPREVEPNCIRSKGPMLLRAIGVEIRYTTVEPTNLNAHYLRTA